MILMQSDRQTGIFVLNNWHKLYLTISRILDSGSSCKCWQMKIISVQFFMFCCKRSFIDIFEKREILAAFNVAFLLECS